MECTELFEAGRLKDFEENWRNLSSDPDILDRAPHCHIEFETEVPTQTKIPFQVFDQQEELIIESEVDKLQKKIKVIMIKEASFVPGKFISPIFTRPKKRWGIPHDTKFKRI